MHVDPIAIGIALICFVIIGGLIFWPADNYDDDEDDNWWGW